MLTDVLKKSVSPGDEVVLLVKIRGYRGLSDAYLGHAIYMGLGPYGHEFIDYEERNDEEPTPFRFKQPECVLLERK